MAVHTILRHTPNLAESVWVAENATVTGNVSIGEQSSVWFQAVIRGDVNAIKIGKHTNIQDGAVVHGSTGKQDTVIGDYVTVGHRAIVHGCTVDDYVLIGMGAIILDDAHIPSYTVVAAGAVVTQGKELEPYAIYAGVPAKKVKTLDPDGIKALLTASAKGYVDMSRVYMEEIG